MEIIIINNSQDLLLPSNDRGLQYGDGFFTTARVCNGLIEHFPLHIARLKECAERLHFDNLDFSLISDALLRTAKKCDSAVLKVVITRGSGGRGYQLPDCSQPRVLISISDFPDHYFSLQERGLQLDTLTTQLSCNAMFAGLKTLNRLEQVMAKHEIAKKGFKEGLLLNTQNEVVESSASNLLLLKNGLLYTPDLTLSGIKGVYLQTICEKIKVCSQVLTLDDFYLADSVFCANSLMGIVPVARIDKVQFSVANALSFIKEHRL
jgi:4-amino-4-deoxychorismate lyase